MSSSMLQVSVSSLGVIVSSQLDKYIAEVQNGEFSVLMPMTSGMPDILQSIHAAPPIRNHNPTPILT